MEIGKSQYSGTLSRLFVGALVVLSLGLGLLQYRWIGEVSRAERERLQRSLQLNLQRLSEEFRYGVGVAVQALIPEGGAAEGQELLDRYALRIKEWHESGRHAQLFRRIAVAQPEGEQLGFYLFSENAALQKQDWPVEWKSIQARMEAWLSREGGRLERRGALGEEPAGVIEIPRLRRTEGGVPTLGRESAWLIVELNPEYVRGVILPELMRKHLPGVGASEYQAEIAIRGSQTKLLYPSAADGGKEIVGNPDGSVGLLEGRFEMMANRPPPRPSFGMGFGGGIFSKGMTGRERNGGKWTMRPPEESRWMLRVRHRAGSLDAVVQQARMRNLAVTGGILVLLLGAVGAWFRYTARAQRLAQLQMEFVAGVSHELRTPLTVIGTAAYNLRGPLLSDPARVRRYGALIQDEAEKLTAIVENILSFSNANAGRVIGALELVDTRNLIDEALHASENAIAQANCTVEKNIETALPAVLADRLALRNAIGNLLTNAAKYGGDARWIGIIANATGERREQVEIRIADRGPGIPGDEAKHVFDPFFRGKRALEAQVHGTGLGLSLAKRIVEAHEGTLTLRSTLGQGTEFVMRLPAAKMEQWDAVANTTDRG